MIVYVVRYSNDDYYYMLIRFKVSKKSNSYVHRDNSQGLIYNYSI
jgi:hypothetical protein